MLLRDSEVEIHTFYVLFSVSDEANRFFHCRHDRLLRDSEAEIHTFSLLCDISYEAS